MPGEVFLVRQWWCRIVVPWFATSESKSKDAPPQEQETPPRPHATRENSIWRPAFHSALESDTDTGS